MNALGSRLPGVLLLGLFVLCDVAYGRTWTTIEGRRSQGELVSFEENQVTLLIDGREYTFPVSRFSAPDRAYLMKWKAEKRCGICRETVGVDKMQAGEQIYHPACFTCLVCERPFLDRQSIRRDEWGGLVHTEHFRQVPRCGTCGRMFSKKTAKPEQFFFW